MECFGLRILAKSGLSGSTGILFVTRVSAPGLEIQSVECPLGDAAMHALTANVKLFTLRHYRKALLFVGSEIARLLVDTHSRAHFILLLEATASMSAFTSRSIRTGSNARCSSVRGFASGRVNGYRLASSALNYQERRRCELLAAQCSAGTQGGHNWHASWARH
jgi:hypothetical protein